MSELTVRHDTVVVRRTYEASRERVFRAWEDPAALARWYTPGDEGWSAKILAHDFRVGGVKRLAFGAGDFTLDMNMTWSRSEAELLAYRGECVLASRAAAIEAPIDTVWVDLKDGEGFAASTRHIKDLGFQGKMCIHPDQVPAANEILSPSAAEVAWSRKVVAAFEVAEKAGSASIQLEGRFIDYPIVYRAQRVLAMMQRIAARAN